MNSSATYANRTPALPLKERDPARYQRLMRLELLKMEKAGTLTAKGKALLDEMRRSLN